MTFTVVGSSDVSTVAPSARIIVSTFVDVDANLVRNFEPVETVALKTY